MHVQEWRGENNMKRTFAVMLCLAVMCTGAWGAYYDEGNDGDSWETAYVIDALDDLIAMQNNSRNQYTDKYYKLGADIEITVATAWEGINNFAGYFDGQKHTIKINSSTTTLFKGLRGSISNLNVEGKTAWGGIANIFGRGSNADHASITNCNFSGTVETTKTGTSEDLYMGAGQHFAGGIVGNLQAGVIRDCTFSGTVRVVNADDEYLDINACAGGIVGQLLSTGFLGTPTVENCTVSSSTIISARTVGGIVGLNPTSVGSMQLSGNTWPNQYPEIGTRGTGNIPGTNPYTPNPENNEPVRELNVGVITSVPYLSDDVIERLAQNISVDPSELILLTSTDFDPSDPPEPTNAMRQRVQSDNGQFMAKLNTINVKRDGWYVFMVTVSDDLVGTKVSDLKLYAAESSDFTASSVGSVSAAFDLLPMANGLTGTLEISNLFGVKLDTLPKQFLATMFLSASKSITVYIVKIIIMLLTGCDTGIGIIGGGLMIVTGGVFITKHIKRKKH